MSNRRSPGDLWSPKRSPGDQRSPTMLITTPALRRGFGIDTTQTAIGRLPAHEDTEDQSLTLSLSEFDQITELLTEACTATATKPVSLSTPFKNANLLHKMRVRSTSDLSNSENLSVPREFEIDILCETTHHTRMIVRLQQDRNGSCWLNIRANPSSLINGYNAFAVAIEGVSARDELGRVLRLPFRVFAMLLREMNPVFRWEKETAKRIKKLLFKACPVQVFTYMDPTPFSSAQLLGFLRIVLSCPLGDGQGGSATEGRPGSAYGLLGDLLGIQIDARLVGGLTVQTLLLRIHRGGEQAVSANFYDKHAEATNEAAARNVIPGEAETRRFLSQNLRVDVTMHAPALRELQAEAGIARRGSAVLTAARFRRAIRVLDRGKGKSGKPFEQWLLNYIFDECLPLLRLLNYRPSLLDEVRAKLAMGKNGAEMRSPDGLRSSMLFDEWLARGFEFERDGRRLSFEQFAQHFANNRVSRQGARTIRNKAWAWGLDLDLPLVACNAIFNIRHVIDLDRADQHALAVAFEQCDSEALLRLTQISKANSGRTIADLSGALSTMIASAYVPAVLIGGPKDDEADSPAAPHSAFTTGTLPKA